MAALALRSWRSWSVVQSLRRASTSCSHSQKYHLIGQPNPESNLVPIKLKEPTKNKHASGV